MELALGVWLSGHCVRALAHTFQFLHRNEGSEKRELGLWMSRPTTHSITSTLDRTLRLPLHIHHLHNPYMGENGSDLYPRYDHGVQHLVVY